jgi:hypothetical protein
VVGIRVPAWAPPAARMDPPPRSLGTDAYDCIMVGSHDPPNTSIRRGHRVEQRAPPWIICADKPLPQAQRPSHDRAVPAIKLRAVLAAVKAASRRLRRWPAASLDRGCARRDPQAVVGTEKRSSVEQRNNPAPRQQENMKQQNRRLTKCPIQAGTQTPGTAKFTEAQPKYFPMTISETGILGSRLARP